MIAREREDRSGRQRMERGPAEMRLDQAIELLRGKPGSIEDLGPDYVRQARAAAVYADGVRDGAVLSEPVVRFHDAAPPLVRSQSIKPRKGGAMHIHIHGTRDDNAAEIKAGEQGTNGAQRADGRVGAKLVQKLPGPASAYFIAIADDGSTGLYRSADVDGQMDPGSISLKSTTLNADQKRAVTRDARRSNVLLRRINEANRQFWAGK
jgi:hypothetical protein